MATNKPYLPDKISPKGQALALAYPTTSNEQLDEWAKQYGYLNRDSFKAAMRRRWGLQRIWVAPGRRNSPEPKVEVRVITPEIMQYKPLVTGKGDPETQVVIIGDDHAGEITPTFNVEVYKQRFKELFQKTLRITSLHRNMYPLNDLVIIDVGDNVQGENPYQGATVEAVACGAVNQIYDVALPVLIELLVSFRQEFKTVKFYGVRGNHGRYSLTAPRTSNWDMALYQSLKGASLPSGIEINYSDDFKAIVNIEGFDFFVFHGDQVRTTMGIPYFALIRKVKDWYSTFGGFPYAVCGHFHKEDFLRMWSKTKLLINGSLVTDDPYALEVIGTSSIPTHWTFGVHKHTGLTWLYNLILDKSFLPERKVKE
jgi:hypothetical protein